jgi:iron complex outermembrane receptor protein
VYKRQGKRWGGRISLLLKPTDTFSARITAFRQEQSLEGGNSVEVVGANATPLTPPDNQHDIANNGRLESNSYFGNPSDNRYQYLNLTMSLDTPFFNLLSSTSYGELYSFFRTDITQANAAPGLTYGQVFGGVYGLPIVGLWGRQENSSKRWNQELRISSLPDSQLFGMRFDWQGGLFYAHESVTFSQFYDALNPAAGRDGPPLTVPIIAGGSNLPGSYEEFAGFANGTFHLTDALKLTLGGRLSTNNQRSQVINGPGLVGSGGFNEIVNPVVNTEESNFTWTGALRYEINAGNMVYARIASGYRPGGPVLRIPLAPPDFPVSYASDSVINYEIGYRGTLWDNRFTIDVAGFWLDWTDIQVITQFQSGNGQVFNVQGNGAAATSKGFEWNVAVEPLKGLRLSVVGAYTDATITEDSPAIGAVAGDPLPQVPKWSNTVNLDYSREFGVGTQAYAGLSWQYVGERYTNFGLAPGFATNYEIPAYNVVNGQLGVDLANYTFGIYVRNIFDERGLTNYNRGGGYNLTGTAELLQPRTFGVRVGVRF